MYGFGRVNHKQVIIDSFKHCEVTVVADGSEDLLIHCLKPNQVYTAGIDRLKAGVNVNAVLTSLNTAFLPISRSRFKRH